MTADKQEKDEETKKGPEGLDIRYTEFSDAPYLKQWLSDPSVGRWFPMADHIEVDDAVNRWIGFARYRSSLTATIADQPVGLTTLFLQPYRKLAHQCEFGIIVHPDYRNQGIGTDLIRNLCHLGKEYFKLEILHLQVYAKNPAFHLYERLGFREFGRQTHWIKEPGGEYVGRIFMEKFL